MKKPPGLPLILAIVMTGILIRVVVPALQTSKWLWLVAVTVGSPWIIWHVGSQLYTAALKGYILTDVPERKVYRDKEYTLFRNNVVAWIVMGPMIVSGAVIVFYDAWSAVL